MNFIEKVVSDIKNSLQLKVFVKFLEYFYDCFQLINVKLHLGSFGDPIPNHLYVCVVPFLKKFREFECLGLYQVVSYPKARTSSCPNMI